MTINQMDVLAGFITWYFLEGYKVDMETWVKEYELNRENLSRYLEERANGETADTR